MTEKERNINWFDKNNKRRIILEQFYIDLEKLGINHDIGIKSDCHREDFRFIITDTIDKTLLEKIYPLTLKYEKLINKTYVDCGKKINQSGSDFFCEECYLIKRKAYNYENISDLGFSTYISNIEKGYYRNFFYWSEFFNADFIFEESIISSRFPQTINLNFKKTKRPPNKTEAKPPYEWSFVSISDWYENYFILLKHIPDCLLNKKNRSIKANLIKNLNDCGICGYKAVFEHNLCLVCKLPTHVEMTERIKKHYSSVDEINKSFQLQYYKDHKNRFKYPRREREFEKSSYYKILITEKELEEYIKQ